MQLHQLKPIYRRKRRKRVGRGGKRGTYSGRGIKGQKARAGKKLRPAIRELIKRYPKLRGYRFGPKRTKPAIVNLTQLSQRFKSLEIVSPKILLQKGIIRKIKGRIPEVKILGRGKLTKKLVIEGCLVSKSAKEKIEKAGGTIKILNPKS